jgi:hypothetical protein
MSLASLEKRVVKLELRDTEREGAGPVSFEDVDFLFFQHDAGNLELEEGRAVWRWPVDGMDAVLRRLNAWLHTLEDQPRSTPVLIGLLRVRWFDFIAVEDVPRYTDDEIIEEVTRGLAKRVNALGFSGGVLVASAGGVAESYWRAIAERARTIERVYFPLSTEDIRAALDALSTRKLLVGPANVSWRSHRVTIQAPYNDGIVNEWHELSYRVAHAFNVLNDQIGCGILETADEVRGALELALAARG